MPSIINLNAKAGRSAVLCLMFVFLQALVMSPALHDLVHPDAKSPNHECAVTLLSHGQVETSSVDVGPVLPAPSVLFLDPIPATIVASTDTPVMPGRGPPSVS